MDHRLDAVTIRIATSDDAPALTHLHLDVWEDAYSNLMPPDVFVARRANVAQRVERWRSMLSTSPCETWVAEVGNALIGFASVGPGRDQDVALDEEVWALYVRAAWWGRGVGHALLAAALGERTAYLWVLEGNDRALCFYRRQGFVADGSTRVDGGNAELRMRR